MKVGRHYDKFVEQFEYLPSSSGSEVNLVVCLTWLATIKQD